MGARIPSPRFFAALSLSLLAVTFTFCVLKPIYWEDVWWHLGVGEYIATHHKIPLVDIYSWTVRGAPWINHEWLYQLLLYYLVRLMGIVGATFLKTILMWIALYFLDRRLKLWHASVIERLIILGLSFAGAWPFWVERADLSSLALLSALLFDLDRSRLDPEGGLRNRLLWMILFALWPNIHGAYLIGLIVIGLHAMLQLLRRPAVGRRTFAWVACCAVATLANPYGVGLLLSIARTTWGKIEFVAEWLPSTGWGLTFFYVSVAVSILTLALPKKWTFDDLYDVAILTLFAVYALEHERFVHFFMIAAFPYAARQWLKCRWRLRLSNRLRILESPALVFSAALLTLTSIASARSIHVGISAENAGYIPQACDFIESRKIDGPFYNDYKFGSYLIWRFRGRPPVYQDGREWTVVGYDALIAQTLQAQRSPKAWNTFTDNMGIQAALVRYPPDTHSIKPAAFDSYFPRSAWGLVYWDDLSLLFVRRTSQNAALLAQYEFRVIKPDWTLETYLDQLRRHAVSRRALRAEIARKLTEDPNCWRAKVYAHWLEESTK